MKETEARHLGIVAYSPHVIARMNAGVFEVIGNQVPEGAKIVNAWYDPQRDWFCITLEHESFPLVPEGGMIPFLDVPVIRSLPLPTSEK